MSLIEISKQFDDTTLRAFRSCIGHVLVSCDAYCLNGESEHIYKTARLNFDAFSIDLINEHEELVLGPEYTEEQVAILSAGLPSGDLWTPPGKGITHAEYNMLVNDVLIVIDEALLTRGSRRLIDFKWTQAVLFEDEFGGLLAFDRDIWSDEYITVRRGPSIATTTRDFRPDWVAEPPYEYKFGRSILRLSKPGN